MCQRSRVGLFRDNRHLRRLNTCQIEYVSDEILEMLRVAMNNAQIANIRSWQRCPIILRRLCHQFGEGDNQVQWSTQFVADGLRKLLLQAMSFSCLIAFKRE